MTRRANGRDNYIELAGFPHHALDTYLPKLVRAGKRVAICEQLEDPKLKKIPKQKVVETVTPNQPPKAEPKPEPKSAPAPAEPPKAEPAKEIEIDGIKTLHGTEGLERNLFKPRKRYNSGCSIR